MQRAPLFPALVVQRFGLPEVENGGLLEHAQRMAGHASAGTTKLYDRRGEQVSLDEVGRIVL